MNTPFDPSNRTNEYQTTTQKVITALLLGLGVLIGMTLTLGSSAFAQNSAGAAVQADASAASAPHELSFASAYTGLAAYVDTEVAVTAWLTYVPDNRDQAILRNEKATQYQSLLVMNLQTFGDAQAAGPDDKALFVNVTRVPGQARAWMVRSCADGCRVRAAGHVVRTADGKIRLDVRKVQPAAN